MEPTIRRRQELLAAGYTPDEVRRRVRSGAMLPVRRGAYVVGAFPREPEAAHALRVRAAVPQVADRAVVSHVSAAVLHGIPLWNVPLDRVHVTRSRRAGARRGAGVHLHAAPLAGGEVHVVCGIAVTSPARTVVDLARTVAFEPAVVIADGALRLGLTTPDLLAEALARAARRPGTPAARRVVAFADARGGSVGESRSRVRLRLAGLPSPELQWAVSGPSGPVGTVDFGWPQLRTVGEFDGRVKYGRLLRPGQSPGDAVFDEKVREDALRGEGLWVVRWIWPELDDFDVVVRRLRRAFQGPDRFR